jgi:threonine dehydrogenase-like Zn-dependent dehydrogenase
MKVPVSTLVPLPDALTFEEGAAISLKRLDVSGRDTLAVFGQGPVGLSATLLGRAMGTRVVAVDPSRERRTLAEAFGTEAAIDPKAIDPVAALRDLTHGEGVDVALDCSGNPEARIAAVRSACTWGRVGFVGEGNTTTFDISQDLIRKQLTIIASWTFSSVGQAECARFIADRQLPLGRLLTHRFRLEEADAAYRLFDTQTTGKGVFVL